MINFFTKYGLITVVLAMAACTPVEQKPVITAPTEPAPTEIELIETAPQAPPALIEEIVPTPAKEVAEEMIEIVEEPVAPPPPPLADPYDPAILIGASPARLAATLGRHDHSFDNSGMSVHHYRQEACLMLVFINDADEVTHIDLRHNLVNQKVDITACHQALGARKAALP